jgi:drug/metabolite transporter (DMT)-like permease
VNQELFVALLAGLGGMFGWGLADFFAKKTINEVGDILVLTWGHIFGAAGLVAIAVWRATSISPIVFPETIGSWLLLVVFGVGQAVIYLLVYRGFSKGPVGLLAPIFASFSGLTAILSILIFHEIIRGFLPIALPLIFAGVLLINVDTDALRARRFRFGQIGGIKEVGLATFLAGWWTLLWNKFVGGEDSLSYVLWMYGFMTLAILSVALGRRISFGGVHFSLWKFLALIGLCEAAAYLAITFGYSATRFTSVVAILSGGFSLPTIVLARIFLREKITASQTIGALVVVGGIMLLAASREA